MEKDGPLSGFTTLILRPAGRSLELVQLIEAAGGEAIVSPLISRAPISSEAQRALDELTASISQFGWVAVTSVNAVSELIASFERVGPRVPLQEQIAGVKWATVGPATTAALAAYGIDADFEAAENSAAGMVAQWPHHHTAKNSDPSGFISNTSNISNKVLLPLGDLASTQLSDGLIELGYEPITTHAYRTVSHPASDEALAAWWDGDIDIVVLTSGSVVREFVKQFDPLEEIPKMDPYFPLFIAIGGPTTRAALAAGLSVDIVANQASNTGLFHAIMRGANLVMEGN